MASFATCMAHITVAAFLVATSAEHTSHIMPHGELIAGHRHHGLSFMRRRYNRLRICNAYPSPTAIDVLRRGRLLTSEPMPFKSCGDFKLSLEVGDKIQFEMGEHFAGIFVVQAVPHHDEVMLLVVRRHDTVSTAVSFTSHLFARSASAQIAVIDTTRGMTEVTASIAQLKGSTPQQRKELRFNSLAAIPHGTFEVSLSSNSGQILQRSKMVALNHESYIILRTGFETDEGEFIPQELVIYPHSDPSELPENKKIKENKGNAAQAYSSSFLCTLVALLATFAS